MAIFKILTCMAIMVTTAFNNLALCQSTDSIVNTLTWDEQFDFVIKNGGGGYKNIIGRNGMYLIRYELDSVTSFDSFRLDTISPETYFPIPVNADNYDNEFNVICNIDSSLITRLNKVRNEILANYEGKPVLIVNLFWVYKNKEIVTKCAVDPVRNKIIYDIFVSSILHKEIEIKTG